MKIGNDPVLPCSWGTVPLSDARPVRSLKQKSRPCRADTPAKPFIFPSAGDASTDDGFKAETEVIIMQGINIMVPIRDDSKSGEMITFRPKRAKKARHTTKAEKYARALLGIR